MTELEKKRILIVEDDPNLVDMLRGYFEYYSEYEIHAAGMGVEGVSLARELRPDLVLQDIRLPDIDGFEVVRRLRQGGRKTEKIPVIFLTERQERRDRLLGLELGAVDYITKPFDMQELRLRVRNTLRRARAKSLVNPVTHLPLGTPVRERLEEAFKKGGWGMVLAGLEELDHFRDTYGFVAADDVVRATAIILANTMASGRDDGFLGHLDEADFVAVTADWRAPGLADRFAEMLAAAVPQYYPAVDREKWEVQPDPQRLRFTVTVVTARDGRIRSLRDLGARLNALV